MSHSMHNLSLLDAVPTAGFSNPPYHVEHLPIGSCVCREDGFNCLSFKSKPGAKFTDAATAHAICDLWNGAAIEQWPAH